MGTEEGKSSKIRKRLTLDDVAAAVGQDATSLKGILEQKLLEKEAHAAGATEADDEMFDDSWADEAGRGKNTEFIDERLRVVDAKTKVMEYELHEMMSDMYRNTIRIVAAPRVKAAEFREYLAKMDKDLLKPNVIQVKKAAVHCDIIFKTFDNPKKATEELKKSINTHANKKIHVLPPYSPEGNVFRAGPRAAFKATCTAIEEVREDVDDILPKQYKPSKLWPVTEAQTPKFSLQAPTGRLFLTGEFDRHNMVMKMDIEESVTFADVVVQGSAIKNEIVRFYTGPYKAAFRIVPKRVEGLTKAPDFEEARKSKYFPQV